MIHKIDAKGQFRRAHKILCYQEDKHLSCDFFNLYVCNVLSTRKCIYLK